MKAINEITNRKSQLELQKGSIERELKELTAKQQNFFVNQAVDALLQEQEEKGKLDRLTLQVFLQQLAVDARNLYDK